MSMIFEISTFKVSKISSKIFDTKKQFFLQSCGSVEFATYAEDTLPYTYAQTLDENGNSYI